MRRLAGAALVPMLVLAGGAAWAETQRPLAPFDTLAVDTAMSVELVCGPAPELAVFA